MNAIANSTLACSVVASNWICNNNPCLCYDSFPCVESCNCFRHGTIKFLPNSSAMWETPNSTSLDKDYLWYATVTASINKSTLSLASSTESHW
jgi:hypothetical protein